MFTHGGSEDDGGKAAMGTLATLTDALNSHTHTHTHTHTLHLVRWIG